MSLQSSGSRHVAMTLRSPYRAQADPRGEWYVWRRVGAGWATHRRCDSQQDAIATALQLNAEQLPLR